MKYKFFPIIIKKVGINEPLYNSTLELANQMGLTYQEYIRYLLTQDLRRSQEKSDILIKDTKARLLIKMIQEIKKGSFKNINDVEKALQDLIE